MVDFTTDFGDLFRGFYMAFFETMLESILLITGFLYILMWIIRF